MQRRRVPELSLPSSMSRHNCSLALTLASNPRNGLLVAPWVEVKGCPGGQRGRARGQKTQMKASGHSSGSMIGSRRRLSPQTVTIGLLNNMGDEALKITERQFAGLIDFAAGKTEIRLRIFVLEHIPRSPGALEYINGHCEPITAVLGEKLDGLIITGAQPRTVRLSDEPYWRELTEIIDWAKDHTTSTILSCLAAHAAVYHLDGIERRPLREKCFGLFPFRAHGDHSFGGKQGRGLSTPHSRYNEVLQSDLELAGYDILTSSPVHGADIFTKTFGSKFVFLQGHPEYDAKSLAREYRRDLSRYLRGDMEKPPAMPKGYFADEAETELRGIERRAREDGRLSPAGLLQIEALAPPRATWREAAISFYRDWIDTIAASGRRCAASGDKADIEPSRDGRSECKLV